MIHRTSRLAAGAAGLAFAAGACAAGEPLSLLLPVTYQENAAVLHKTKEACQLEDKVAADLAAELRKRAGHDATTAATTGVVLRVTILGSRGIGGGGWTGAKSLALKVDELKDGELVRSRSFSRNGRGGLAGAFEGTCGILEGLSRTLATDVVDWSGIQTDARFDADLATRRAAVAQAAADAAADPAEAAASAAN